jgi:WD40 repeat protein
MRSALVMIVALLGAAGCEQAQQALGSALPSRKGIAELKYSGDRPDAPPLEQRGNAAFSLAAFDDTGALLITQTDFGSSRMQVWDMKDGTLVSGFDAIVPNPGGRTIWMIDSKRRRLLTRTGKNDGFALIDLMSGKIISTIADTDDGAGGKAPEPPAFREPYTVGFTNDATQVVIFKPGVIELWDVDPVRLAKRVPSPLTEQRFHPAGVGGTPGSTYTDTHFWEWSSDRRTLAVAFTPEDPVNAYTKYWLIDAATLELERLELPEPARYGNFASFAFSPDERWLAIGNNEGMWIYDRVDKSWARYVAGDHKRNRALAPMRFTADGTHVITLGDQLQVSSYDVATGELAGRLDTIFENWEGEIKISDDGSRVVVYRFLSDTFEILDGPTAKPLGWVCPYFCNVKHAPIQPGYAVSPDGKTVAISHRRGVAVWDTATDQIKFPLTDAKRKPLPYPRQ